MPEKLIQYVAAATPDVIRTLLIEDAAVCKAYCQSIPATSENEAVLATVQSNLESWLSDYVPAPPDSEGRRQQPLIRSLVEKIHDGRTASLNRAELDVLCAVSDLLDGTRHRAEFERLIGLFEEFKSFIRNRRNALPAAPGLDGLRNLPAYVSSSDLAQAKPRSVKTFAGIAMAVQGPVFTQSGDLRVLDFIPEDCVVVVEKGSCWINGYHMGILAVGQDAVVCENISGVIVAARGEIRSRSILNRAFVVSKAGGIYANTAEQPNLVYAAREMKFRENTLMGSYTAPRIEVEREAFGGDFNVSISLAAERFRRSDVRPMTVALLRRVSSEDYGEIVAREVRLLRSRIHSLRLRISTAEQTIRIARDDIQHFSSNAIVYLCGGEEARKRMSELENASRRMAALQRLIYYLNAAAEYAEERAARHANVPDENTAAAIDVDALESELEELEQEGELDRAFFGEAAAVRRSLNALGMEQTTPARAAAHLKELQNKRARRYEELEALRVVVDAFETEVQEFIGKLELLKRADDVDDKVRLLQRILVGMSKLPPDDPVRAKANSPFFSVLRKKIEKRQQWIAKYSKDIAAVRDEMTALKQKLESEHNFFETSSDVEIDAAAHVIGRFDPGILICSDRHVLESGDAPAHSLVKTRDSMDDVLCFVRRNGMISEAPPPEEAIRRLETDSAIPG